MSAYLDRLHNGERCWGAECIMRSLGLALLYASYRTGVFARQVDLAQGHTPEEFAICAAVFVLLVIGLALTVEGPGLFRLYPMPPRPII